jgi:glycosyltransferase involved in cell wall biosynthesis
VASQDQLSVVRRQPGARLWHDTQQRATRALYQRAKQVADKRRNPRLKIPVSDKTATSTIYFLTPDFNEPAGGIKVIYRHVDILNKVGIDAAVLHQRKGFRCSWFDNETRVTDVGSSAVGPNDVLVVSELHVDHVAELDPGIRHVVLNQSGYLTWTRHGDRAAKHYSNSPDLLGIIVVSEHSAQMLEYAFPDRLIRRVYNGIDSSVFHPPAENKLRQISCFPRRGHSDLNVVLQMLRARGALQDWEILPLQGISQEAWLDRLRASRITLVLSPWEGFGLPAVEAMACGNYVIGYHAFGGREFMRPEFSCPIGVGDVFAVASAVERIIDEDSRDEDWCTSRGKQASGFILEQYSVQREHESVVAAYSDLLVGRSTEDPPAGTAT